MSEADESQKTEDPTSKRLADAKRKGQVAVSKELNTWMMLFGVAILLAMIAPYLLGNLKDTLGQHIQLAHQVPMQPGELGGYLAGLLWTVTKIMLVPFGMFIILALAAGYPQTGIIWAVEKLKPKLDKFNLIKGVKRWFSMSNLVEFGKGMIKIALVAAIGVATMAPYAGIVEVLPGTSMEFLMEEVHFLVLKVLAASLALLFAITIADIFYQRFQHIKQLRMTKQEVKEEFKNMEGDPQIKARLRQIRQERARSRMMQAVPTADVVVTNPTHFAVALAYRPEEMEAPQVVAKGQDVLAFKIREIAEEHDITIVENPPLARGLYAAAEVEDYVPEQFYKAVAEVISYVFNLKGKKLG
ncbi:flagellar biosynthesis protein FlhB [Aestuariispira insulae]|uniref:Flagellar biosynthetic protein FlhB n=1 Tax=Aestuariispira insulae TaxID=1461337 RepID=A0A3D9HSJ3_9PROT|nr:flagellar biosynthesis protein FlhB [Aestuariispira insulae]RED52478.1 flagellar biosynthetic protein FlhB [Aestuariispira insulae]